MRKKRRLGRRLFLAAMGISVVSVMIVSGVALFQFVDI